jgi:N-acyl-D-amino-acid deacylase
MPEFDLVIRDGMIVDGTRMPRYRGDVGIKDGNIAKIGRLRSTDGVPTGKASGRLLRHGRGA